MASKWISTKIRLRPIEPEDWELVFALTSDIQTVRHFDTVNYPPSNTSARKWIEERSAKNGEEWFTWVLETPTGEKVGVLNAFDTNRRNGTFYYGVAIFPEYRRKGFASDAINMMLRFYFHELGYDKCNAIVYDFNETSVRFHEQSGFQLEGRLREMGYTQGRHFDHLIYVIRADDFSEIDNLS